VILINTARADLVDENALSQALRDGRVGSYAADTLSTESKGSDASPLLADDLADRVTLTPHSAAQTVEAVDRMGAGAAEAVRAVLHDRDPDPARVGIVVSRAMLPA
jgi:D-3-phosphoglycerate dehydrogenase